MHREVLNRLWTLLLTVETRSHVAADEKANVADLVEEFDYNVSHRGVDGRLLAKRVLRLQQEGCSQRSSYAPLSAMSEKSWG